LGFCFIEKNIQSLKLIEADTIAVAASTGFFDRLQKISEKLVALTKIYNPSEVAIENTFFGVNAKSAFQLGVARGVILSDFIKNKTPIFEYTPTQIKKAVTGHGHADKEQIKKMVQIILGQKINAKHYDAFDAAAIAVCHALSTRIEIDYDRLPRRKTDIEIH
jgi:crossover junction endodeoxyribonuclease RuvC